MLPASSCLSMFYGFEPKTSSFGGKERVKSNSWEGLEGCGQGRKMLANVNQMPAVECQAWVCFTQFKLHLFSALCDYVHINTQIPGSLRLGTTAHKLAMCWWLADSFVFPHPHERILQGAWRSLPREVPGMGRCLIQGYSFCPVRRESWHFGSSWSSHGHWKI